MKGSDKMNFDTLFIELDKNSKLPLYEQIYNQIRDDIVEGKLEVGIKLPSKRQLGSFLHVSQTTVESAYDQLAAEGFIVSVPRKGFFVQAIEELSYVQPTQLTTPIRTRKEEIGIDFSPGHIDTENFPFVQWRKYAKEVIDESSQDLLLLGDPHGDIELREEIAQYLYHSRGVDCTPEQIIIGSGTEQLLPFIIRILGKDTTFAIEDPGYPLTHYVFSHQNRKVVPIPVDRQGMDINVLANEQADVAYVTPSHQFPTGAVLSAPRKIALLNWASEKENRFIIEDDYDSEFRYTGRPIPALYGMDQGQNVIYISTFSKSLMPSLRMAYTVLPNTLLKRYQDAFIHYVSTVPRLDQHILARFIKAGDFSKHLNRMRTIYKRKLHLLLNALKKYQPNVSYSGEETGMHITLSLQTNETEEQLVQKAYEAGIRLYSLNSYRTNKKTGHPSFIIGFGGILEKDIAPSIHRLMKAWKIDQNES